MEQTNTDEIELDTEIETDTEADAVVEVVSDPAAEAFARLEGEMALMRRAVEHLAAERADIIIPDYGTTLGEMARRLGEMSLSLFAIASKPAMQMTPEDMAARMRAAATQARRDDHIALADAQQQHVEAVRTLRALAGDVASFNEQQMGGRRRLACWMPAMGGAAWFCRSLLPGELASARTHRRAHRGRAHVMGSRNPDHARRQPGSMAEHRGRRRDAPRQSRSHRRLRTGCPRGQPAGAMHDQGKGAKRDRRLIAVIGSG